MPAIPGDNAEVHDALVQAARSLGSDTWGSGWSPSDASFAPGRIELLGNHLDYNGGKVLAAAIDRGIVAVADRAGQPGRIDVVFTDPHRHGSISASIDPARLDGWSRDDAPESPVDYVRGAIASLLDRGLEPRDGIRIAFAGDLPIGLGLSSSAALCVATVAMLAPGDLGRRDWILLAQSAENRAGVACGTMDQAASVAGGVIRYDAGTIGIEELSPDLGDFGFIVVSSGVVHRLGESAYPDRVREMARVSAIAGERLGDSAPAKIADITDAQAQSLNVAGQMNSTLQGRVRHLITERARVSDGYDAIAAQDWTAFGAAMTASGRSSATDYDVSHPQVEELVGILTGLPGVVGARMMGGGSGGSVLGLVRRESVDQIEAAVEEQYFRPHDLDDLPDRFLVCRFGPGAHTFAIDGAS